MRDSTEDEEEKNIDSGKGPVINVEDVDGLATNGHASANGASTEVGGTDTGKGKENDGQITANVESNKNKGQGLAGRINVLMAADVESVIEGKRRRIFGGLTDRERPSPGLHLHADPARTLHSFPIQDP